MFPAPVLSISHRLVWSCSLTIQTLEARCRNNAKKLWQARTSLIHSQDEEKQVI